MDETQTRAPWRTREGDYVNIRVAWTPEGGRWECTSVEVSAIDRPIDPKTIRTLPWGAVMEQHTEYLRQEVERQPLLADDPEVLERAWSQLAEAAKNDEDRKHCEDMAARYRALVPKGRRRKVEPVADKPAKRRPGRPATYGPDHFQLVAVIWREAHSRRDNPTKAVADAFHVSRYTAGKWVARARNEYHLLPPTTRGRAGGLIDDTTSAQEGAEGSGE